MKFISHLDGQPSNFTIRDESDLLAQISASSTDPLAEDLRDACVPNPQKLKSLTRLVLDMKCPVHGIDESKPILKAFGVEIPVDRSVYLRKYAAFDMYEIKDPDIVGERVQIIDLVENPENKALYFVILRRGDNPASGAFLQNASNVKEIAFFEKKGKRIGMKSSPLKEIYIPRGHLDCTQLEAKAYDLMGMKLPLDRDINFILNHETITARPIVNIWGNKTLVRKNHMGSGLLINHEDIRACTFSIDGQDENLEENIINHEISKIIAEQINEDYARWDYQFNRSINADPYWLLREPVSFSLDKSKPVDGIYGNYIVAFDAFIPRDRPVRINLNHNQHIPPCYAHVLDVSADGRIFFMPINNDFIRNYSYPNWKSPNEGALSVFASQVESISFIPSKYIGNINNRETCVYPSYTKSLYSQPATNGIPFGHEKLPVDRELNIRLTSGANFKGISIWHSRIGELLVRLSSNVKKGPCFALNVNQVDLIAESKIQR